MTNVLGVSLLPLVLFGHVVSWVNQYDSPFTFTCPVGSTLTRVLSIHNNHKEDRIWDFSCQAPLRHGIHVDNCKWSAYANEFDQPLLYQCPNGGLISGVSSYSDEHTEDRRFKFYCCDVTGYRTVGCRFTPYENVLDGILNYVTPLGMVIQGWRSYHDNHKEDRRTRFEICDLEREDSHPVG